jgi:hypothetical protein
VIGRIALLDRRRHYGPYWRCSRLMNAEPALQQREARARNVCWFARHITFSRAGDLRDSLLHVDALSGT